MLDSKIKILYVDDEVNNLTAFKATFRREFDISIAESAMEGLDFLGQNEVNIIITDQRMPNMTGIEFLEEVLRINPEPIRMLLTGYSDINAVIDAINKGQVYRYISKPWNEKEFRITIHNAYEVFDLRQQNRELTKKLMRSNRQLEFLLRQKMLS